MWKLIKLSLEPKKILLRAVLIYTSLITLAFLLPSMGSINHFDFFIPIDKLVHFSIHLILVFIWLNVIFIYNNRVINLKRIAITVLSCIVYGIIIEIVQQLFIETRMADFLDIIANSVGTLLGVLIFLKFKFRFNS
ncbi:MAG: VanZ family protein [Flavobacteriaceae bacterium]|jgi:VanZ family protein|uniref:VanZ family protein n=1 Tax=Candidatus Marifrigoribacter sp. Uisw_064 TaxID=3230970 RepID=UPI003AD91787